MYHQMQSDELSVSVINEFWDLVSNYCGKRIRLTFDIETATVIAKNLDDFNGYSGIKLNLYNLMIRLDNLSETSISDVEYEIEVNRESNSVMNAVKNYKPVSIYIED
jgi:hypothetical protein